MGSVGVIGNWGYGVSTTDCSVWASHADREAVPKRGDISYGAPAHLPTETSRFDSAYGPPGPYCGSFSSSFLICIVLPPPLTGGALSALPVGSVLLARLTGMVQLLQ